MGFNSAFKGLTSTLDGGVQLTFRPGLFIPREKPTPKKQGLMNQPLYNPVILYIFFRFYFLSMYIWFYSCLVM